MFICESAFKRDDSYVFSVYDTADVITEDVSEGDLRMVMQRGYSVFGLNNYAGSVQVDTSVMRLRRGMYIHSLGARRDVYELDIEDDGDILLLKGAVTGKGLRRVFIYYRDRISCSFEIPLTAGHDCYVDVNCFGTVSYGDIDLHFMQCEYFDKHYYREDAGDTFASSFIIKNDKIVARKGFELKYKIKDDYVFQDPNTGVISWRGLSVKL